MSNEQLLEALVRVVDIVAEVLQTKGPLYSRQQTARPKENKMKAYLLNEAGGVDNLILSEISNPDIKADEVLVETKAISINPVDTKVRPVEEVINMIIGEERPVIIGWDISGTVAAVGADVTDFAVGDKVFGMVNFPGHGKAYAEYVASPASHLAKMPANISFEDAAATTLAALTARIGANLRTCTGCLINGDKSVDRSIVTLEAIEITCCVKSQI